MLTVSIGYLANGRGGIIFVECNLVESCLEPISNYQIGDFVHAPHDTVFNYTCM